MSTLQSNQAREVLPSVLGLLGGPAVMLWLMNAGVLSGGIGVFLAICAVSGVTIALIGTATERLVRRYSL